MQISLEYYSAVGLNCFWMTVIAWKKAPGLSRLSRNVLTRAKSWSQLGLLSLPEGTFWQRGTGWSWQYPGSFYCHCEEPPWNKHHCSLFLLEQFLNFLFPGQTKDLKYFQDVLVLSWTTKEPADFVLSFLCSRKECGSLRFGFGFAQRQSPET